METGVVTRVCDGGVVKYSQSPYVMSACYFLLFMIRVKTSQDTELAYNTISIIFYKHV